MADAHARVRRPRAQLGVGDPALDRLSREPRDIDAQRIAYYGLSWGGRLGAIIPAVEPRIRLNMVMIGGLASGTALPEVDQINYVTRKTR
ncbi:MAG TPA: hypothetical protein VMN60_01935 [Longimicrobiales bacterium]|nr:hypothetical protein [Longimicrobiales bacterium]